MEFSNNQVGKPKVAFQGNSEDCKDMDAVIFFDGQNFRLERLHKAVKSLRHLRQGETAAALAGSGASGAVSPIHSNGGYNNAEKNAFKAHHVQPPTLFLHILCDLQNSHVVLDGLSSETCPRRGSGSIKISILSVVYEHQESH